MLCGGVSRGKGGAEKVSGWILGTCFYVLCIFPGARFACGIF